jgi:predicted Zn-dependent peptidase
MKPTVKKLKNGISVILSPQKGAQSMTVFVFCRVGSRYETREINGASHFIEHLMFKGTKRRPNTRVLSRELDQYGANFNAMTSKDFTGYYVKIDAKHGALAVDLLHDMLFHSIYDPKEIKRERGVIIEEINMYEDNPKMHIEDILEEVLFPGSTLGWNIAGPRKVIRDITRKQLLDYRDRYYIPSRLTIALAGNVPANAMELLESTFGKVKQPSRPADAEFKPFCASHPLKHPLAIQEKATEQTQVGMAFYGYPWTHPDVHAAKILSTILGGSMSSRLFIQVRERKGLCYAISSFHQPLEDTGLFGIYAGLDRKRLKEAVTTILGEVKKVRTSGVTAEELRRAKDHLRGRITLAFEDSSFQTDWYGKQWMFTGAFDTPEERMKRLDRVTRADVKRVASDLFRRGAMASAVIGPGLKKGTLEKFFDLR